MNNKTEKDKWKNLKKNLNDKLIDMGNEEVPRNYYAKNVPRELFSIGARCADLAKVLNNEIRFRQVTPNRLGEYYISMRRIDFDRVVTGKYGQAFRKKLKEWGFTFKMTRHGKTVEICKHPIHVQL